MKESISEQNKPVNPDKIALLIIDVQQGLFEKSTPIYKAAELLDNIHALVEFAHRSDVPVFYIQHSDQKTLLKGSPNWQLHPRLQPLATDHIVHKQHGNAFEETVLGESLQSMNINTLFVTGLVTHGCVRATCLGARQLGYRVILVKDAHSSYSKKAAEIIEEWHQKLSAEQVELRSTAELGFTG